MIRNIFVAAVAVLLTSASFAANVQEGAFVLDQDKSILRSMAVNKDLTFDHPSINGFEVYGPKGLYQFLRNSGVQFVELNSLQLMTEDVLDYPSPEQIEAQLKDLNAAYPQLTQLIEIGRTNDGRPLLVLKISDNAAIDETEPEFKYISSMHGDEITGREVMVALAQKILKEYSVNPAIKQLVDSTEIYIMASMNPDGSYRRQRGNANYADLNRDFPDFSTSDNQDTPAGREIETQHIMKFQKSRQFALSTNFHGGAEVMNYAWDTIPDKHPFNDLLIEIALDYANKATYIKNNGEFENGITNGYAWYEVNGGMQDWSYHWYNDLQFTVELSTSKWPSYSKIPYYIEQNQEALISQIGYIHQGAGFKFDQSGIDGKVQISKIEGNALRNLGIYNFRNSEFYKVLPKGEYTFAINSQQLKGTKSIQVAVEKQDNKSITPNYVILSE
ncbi:MAG: M14 family zinc carboxypeptidase [Bdellovibrionota bacterium]